MRTTIKRRVRPGRALYGMVWTAERKRQDRLQKAIQKRTAGGRQVYNTQQRKADTTARLTDTTRTTPPNHEEVLQRLEILCMEREDVRPAEPAPPRFVIGDLVHIRPEFWGAFGIGVPMRRTRLQLIKYHGDALGWDAVFCSGHAKGKTTSAFIPNAALMRA
jgi:hypothetical protein